MKSQVKVNNTQHHSDSQGEHIVHLGKLILLKGSLSIPNRLTIKGEFFNPVIISETEKIEARDYILAEGVDSSDLSQHGILKVAKVTEDRVYLDENHFASTWIAKSACKKILALPEQFSDKHLQAIVDEKMKDQDEVLVKCVEGNYNYRCLDESQFEYFICLNQQNHITLFPVKQSLEVETVNDFIEYCKEQWGDGRTNISLQSLSKEWAKKNNY